jgi:hypothetical protein
LDRFTGEEFDAADVELNDAITGSVNRKVA